ncbi:hypothetical protein [Erwinia sp. MYb416]|uniref:hypothetical protein n=1 Tax=Erwinia sp. MYb416 TaxID=3108532 RepID=UPI00309B456F
MKKALIAFIALLTVVPPAFSETRVGVSMAQMDDVFLSRLRGYISERAKTR